jgi:MFS family permease
VKASEYGEWVTSPRLLTATRRRHAVLAAVSAVTTTVVSVMPVFLVGGLAVQISRDLRLTPATLGLVVAVYFGVTAIGSMPVGGLVERYGPARSSRVAILMAAGCMLAIALAANTIALLVILLALAATANSLGQLASNSSLAQSVPPHRHGLTFGAKQSAIPLSTLLAGVAVPTVALTLGWRWAFGFGALLAVGALVLVPKDQPDPRSAQERQRGRVGAGLVVLGMSAALAAGAANALGAFLVDSSVGRGLSEAAAGLTLTLGSALCVTGRVVVGWVADRWERGHLAVVAGLLAVGTVGLGLLAVDSLVALVIGVLLAFGLGWCWPGLLAFAVVRLRPHAPAAATSVTQTGVYAGAAAGPLGFGVLASHTSYGVAWMAAAIAEALAAILVLVGARLA